MSRVYGTVSGWELNEKDCLSAVYDLYSINRQKKCLFLNKSTTHIFHVVLDPVLLEVGRCLSSVEPLSRVHVRLLKVVPVDLQLVIRVGAQVHCSETKRHEEVTLD